LEANIWAMLSYATGIGEERQEFRGIHTSQFLGHVLVSLGTTTDRLTEALDPLAADILRLVFFAMGWPSTADDPRKLFEVLKVGYEFNQWPPPETATE